MFVLNEILINALNRYTMEDMTFSKFLSVFEDTLVFKKKQTQDELVENYILYKHELKNWSSAYKKDRSASELIRIWAAFFYRYATEEKEGYYVKARWMERYVLE